MRYLVSVSSSQAQLFLLEKHTVDGDCLSDYKVTKALNTTEVEPLVHRLDFPDNQEDKIAIDKHTAPAEKYCFAFDCFSSLMGFIEADRQHSLVRIQQKI
jgi:hypothetical protein